MVVAADTWQVTWPTTNDVGCVSGARWRPRWQFLFRTLSALCASAWTTRCRRRFPGCCDNAVVALSSRVLGSNIINFSLPSSDLLVPYSLWCMSETVTPALSCTFACLVSIVKLRNDDPNPDNFRFPATLHLALYQTCTASSYWLLQLAHLVTRRHCIHFSIDSCVRHTRSRLNTPPLSLSADAPWLHSRIRDL